MLTIVLTADVDSAGVVLLLDFLMGSSIDEVRRRHRLQSIPAAEEAIRALLLQHGYGAVTPRTAHERDG